MPRGAGRSGEALTGRQGIDGKGGIRPRLLPCPPSVPPHGRRLHPPPTPPRSHLGPKGRRRAPSRVMWPGLPHSSGPLVPWRAWHGPPWGPPEPAPPSPQSVGTSLEDPEWWPAAARLSCAQLCFCPQGDFRAAHRTSAAMKCELLASRLKPRNQTGVEGKQGRS